ncbi:MAG TPA: metalloregulator ArsR/SmtB family transcription factor [Candidatus Binatia bacterium]|jgi:DNA-binding transcriptional ArsR family regulator|nr:metalloregulator ArsR/SmtB family transcription factor [Candidatus Binatia bacterium]
MSTAKKKKLSNGQLVAVARLFAVLSESSRLALLQALQAGPLNVSDLMGACGLKQANVSKHLAVLHDHRLVKRQRNGTSVRYEIADPMIFSLCNLVCGKMERDAKQAAALFHPEI